MNDIIVEQTLSKIMNITGKLEKEIMERKHTYSNTPQSQLFNTPQCTYTHMYTDFTENASQGTRCVDYSACLTISMPCT